jgi:hypothetical protein
MMQSTKWILIAAMFSTISLFAAATEPVITKTMALKAATLFRNADPFFRRRARIRRDSRAFCR